MGVGRNVSDVVVSCEKRVLRGVVRRGTCLYQGITKSGKEQIAATVDGNAAGNGILS